MPHDLHASSHATVASEPGKPAVAMVIQRFRPLFSGQGIQLEQLCRRLADAGVHSSVFTAVTGRPDEVERHRGYTVHRLRCDLLPGARQRNAVWMPTFALRVGRELTRQRRRFGWIHVHGLTDALYGAWLAHRLRAIPLIFHMTLFGDDDVQSVLSKNQRLGRIRRWVFRHCDAYVAMSPTFVDGYRQAGLPESRLFLIPQGVDEQRFRPADRERRCQIRAQLGIDPDAPVLVFVGSLIERKGLDLLVSAWNELAEHHPEARLLLVGREQFDRPEPTAFLDRQWQRLQPQAARRALRLGQRDDVHRLLAAADIFVFPSRREGFGSVIIEAMASGLPCVISEMPGISDWILGPQDDSQRRAGIIVPHNDAAAVVAAADALLRDPERRAELGQQARQRVLQRFCFERVIQQYLELYRRLGGAPG